MFRLVALFVAVTAVGANKNNVCKSFEDYYKPENNPNCWYNFAADVTVDEIIRLSGYPVTTHKVATADGYILTLFRIPGKKNPVFLQHGILATAALFVGIGNDSLAFVLARDGYDVWLGNMRGNQYAEEHVNLTVYDNKFWDYSMDEIGLYDIPAQLNYVSAVTGQKGNIIFVAHSLGSTAGLIYSTSYPEEARDMVKFFVYLAPAGTLPNMVSPARNLIPFVNPLLNAIYELDLIRLVSHSEFTHGLVKRLCLESPRLMRLCMQGYNLFYGTNTQFGPESVPVYYNQVPGGFSFKAIDHAADLVRNNFRKYDYGIVKNLQVYGSQFPPNYDISRILVPCYFMYAVGDWAITPKDVRNLYRSLPKNAQLGIDEVNVTNFNHIDFLFGRNVKSIVYDRLLNVLHKNN